MPPEAMASRLVRTARSSSGRLLRWWMRSAEASVMAAGNLGAPPKPPHWGSKEARMASPA